MYINPMDNRIFVYFQIGKHGKDQTAQRKSQGKTSQSERMLCPFCPKTFGNKEERNRHIVECTDSRMFCEFCNYNTNKRAYLNKHIRKMHCSAESTDISDIETDVPKMRKMRVKTMRRPKEDKTINRKHRRNKKSVSNKVRTQK